ncbi:MAG: hypothetical protein EOO88_31575 [Pedobacter sp.]|nr:MAG: hypothetical protein EOO88_31575 [Pedobacter sp.]
MGNIISENNPNDKRGLSDLEWCNELYNYLQDKPLPEEAGIVNTSGINLSEEHAFKVIWFLQEHLRVIPDNIERCNNCGDLYDANNSGYYTEEGHEGMHNFCDACEYLAPIETDEV